VTFRRQHLRPFGEQRALDFELRDAHGRRVAADVVRIVDLDDGVGGRVAAHFRAAMADAPAWERDFERDGRGENDAGV
jgi:hypothetical protein